MASLLHSAIPLSHNNHSSSSSLPKNTLPRHLSKASSERLLGERRSLICKAGLDDAVSSGIDDAVSFTEKLPDRINEAKAASLKLKLLSAVSGLNRGLAASEDDLKKADAAAKELESCAGAVDLTADLDKLQGRWKLIYSSAFSSRTLGGSRPGPPTGRLLPITLGQVFQRIDVVSKDFDNIVELELGAPWPFPPIEATATLAHKFELIGSSTIKIKFEKTTVKTTGNLSQLPQLEVPQIPDQFRPSSNTGSGDFDVTYIDSDTRVTRGDKGELRVFVIA
ncbi:plastid-lipid-associated protein 6, chloroplastic [Lycium ferocissimum]|uniref:plastid-lipid-associated protein 6, chloroplastic n=1 Tax=Lycium ferocissimum TaxID=112874 RepID=UPI0028155B27|nr:plastid-lipid-associated protein 6, chloroplastic [Lycium ferocissimum]